MQINNAHQVFSTLARFAAHATTEKAMEQFLDFSESNATDYVFTNSHGETYLLKATAASNGIPTLTYPENDYSGDPAVTEIVNASIIVLNR